MGSVKSTSMFFITKSYILKDCLTFSKENAMTSLFGKYYYQSTNTERKIIAYEYYFLFTLSNSISLPPKLLAISQKSIDISSNYPVKQKKGICTFSCLLTKTDSDRTRKWVKKLIFEATLQGLNSPISYHYSKQYQIYQYIFTNPINLRNIP